jgi:SAM-dependent methyltransferase
MNNPESYWNQRVLKHGHTGFGLTPLYIIEQYTRTIALRKILRRLLLDASLKSVLDYGCGDATLAASIAKSFDISLYVGYDISREVLRIAAENFSSKSTTEAIFTSDSNHALDCIYNLALLVTVLQHIPSPQLESVLKSVFDKLASRGLLVVLDNCYADNSSSDYIRTSLDSDSLTNYYSSVLGIRPEYSVMHISNVLSFVFFLQHRKLRLPLLGVRRIRLCYAFLFLPFLILLDYLQIRLLKPTYVWVCFRKP